MTGREYLDYISSIDFEINAIREEIECYEKEIPEIAKPILSELKVEYERLLNEKALAGKMIGEMQDVVYKAVLRRRYILGEGWKAIAKNCGNMCERNAHLIRNKALEEFERIYNKHKQTDIVS